jgi:hypothetical protein
MIQKKKPDVDVIMDILNETLQANPTSSFIQSLLFQYQERGGLSKKQLEGLHSKASKLTTISPGKLATLEAIILKKPTRYKSPLPTAAPAFVKDTATGDLITAILQKYPQHKRVLFYKARFDNNDLLSATDKSELEKFAKILLK